GFSLGQNYPNPFAATTTFTYTTPTEAPVELTLSDLTGRTIRTITSGKVSAGAHEITINADELASGTYIVSLSSGAVRLNRQMVVTK
ncbi:MAG TPA: T9SS type A sorting domain-containing protein, partial [Candidatus Kapabacteria bacterium]|nr:T9SS type A sorting domain-containing protein [Candidatus Kapabacteria bacterium]